jgi:DNA-binding CsgD family transcriptional regulator
VSATSTEALLERDAELRRLRLALAALERGRGGSVVLYGPAGIGKTELLRATLDLARTVGLRTALARASEFERAFPFGVVRQLLEPAVAEVPADERGELFAGAAAIAAETLGPVADPVPLLDQDAGRSAYATLHGLYWLCVHLADRGPLVLAVDDLQWADPTSLRLISFLARRIEGLPILLLATLRHGSPSDSGAEDLVVNRIAHVLRPGPLSAEAIGRLVRRGLAGEPHPRFVRACHDATRGNPLYAQELLAALRERGVEPTSAAAADVREIGPRSVTTLVLGRLAALGPAAERVARVAALLGDDADAELVRGVADLPGGELAEAARLLAQADLVRIEPRVRFVHPVSRAAIVAALETGERSALARAAADLLAARGDVEGEAGQLLAVLPAGDPGTVRTLRHASARALGRGAPEAAVTLLQRALVEPPPPAEEARVLHELGMAELRTHASVAPVHLSAALDLTPPGPDRVRLADDLARALHNLNRSDEAAQVAEAALAEPGAAGAPARERLAARAVELARFVPDGAALERRIAPAVAAIEDPTLRARVRGVHAYGAMLANAPAADVAAEARRALHDGALTGHTADGSMPGFLACMALAAAGDADGAAREIELALEAARRRGSVVSYTGALSIRARLRIMRGDLRAAEADARELEDLGDEGLGRDYVAGWLLESLVGQGRLEEAEAVIASGALAGDVPDRIVFNAGLHARGLLRLAQGRRHEALADIELCGLRQEAAGVASPADVPWRGTLAVALLALGRRAEADAASARHLHDARTFAAPAVLGAALRVRGVVVGGEQGRELLEEAASLLAQAPAALEHARALLETGRARHAAGDGPGARAALQQARELADAAGAEPLSAAVVEALVAAGGRPRRARARGSAALTPAERRVAEQAARGMTNREIAQAMFVTEKTVEGHLSKAYRKLGVTARAQLAAAFAAEG